MSRLDKIDEQIVQRLVQNARQSSQELAEQLGMSSATVRRRVRRLLDSGMLRIAALVDPGHAGLTLPALIACNVERDKLQSVIQTLASRPEVRWVSPTTGRFDVFAFVRFHSIGELYSFIQDELAGLEGVKESETFICLQVAKGDYL